MDHNPPNEEPKLFSINDMHCASCVQKIENALKKLEQVSAVSVNFATKEARITGEVSDEAIIQAINRAGYSASKTPRANPVSRMIKIRTATSILAALPLIAPLILALFGIYIEINRSIQLSLATLVQLFGGWPYYRGAVKALKTGSANMNTLIAIGTSAAYLYSLWLLLFTQSTTYYFETATTLIALISLGRLIEEKATSSAMGGMSALLKLKAKSARIRKGEGFVDIPIEKIERGDVIQLRAGERVPIDGIVIEGSSHIDESMLTGESHPVYKPRDATTFAGTLNGNGSLLIKATKQAGESTLDHIIDLVKEAQSSKAPIERLADTISSYFVPVVLAIALLTATIWWALFNQPIEGLINSIATLVIACPCALGLATPMVIMVASAKGAKEGILLKEAAALERAHKMGVIIIDKTGTVTEGKLQVVDSQYDHNEFYSLAKGLAARSDHPLSQAIYQYTSGKCPSEIESTDFKAHPGQGVEGIIANERYYLGSLKFLQTRGIDTSAYDDQLEREARIVVCLASSKMIGYFALEDQIKEGSIEALKAIQKMGIKAFLLSGDRLPVVERVAGALHFDDFKAEVLPSEKAQYLAEKQARGLTVGMMGDGINDAPALAAADIGFAVGSGSDIAMENASIGLMNGDLTNLYQALRLSKLALAKIRQNLCFAFFYNAIGIPLAALGYLNPIIAGGAMALSSISVVINALLLRRKKLSRKL